MGSPYVREIRMFADNFAPLGWAFCNGAAISITENATLFNLIGATYGSDGVNSFNLPSLQSRVPIHQGSAPFGTFTIGQPGGAEAVTLSGSQISSHTHTPQAVSGGASVASPANAYPATTSSTQPGTALYGTGSGKPVTLSSLSVGPVPAANRIRTCNRSWL